MTPHDGFRVRTMRETQYRPPSAWRRASRRSFSLTSALAWVAHTLGNGARWLIHKRKSLGWKRFLFRASLLCILLFGGYLGLLWLTLPNISDPTALLASQSTIITDRNGIELYRLYGDQDRTYVPATQIAEPMRQAIVAIEDQRYYQHGCIEMRSIFRAVVARFTGIGVAGGASTITQQLARNALLSREQTVTRKLREMMLACELERVYDKDKLLEMYLNWIPFGQNAYGVEQASRLYFGVSAKDLTIAQAATLAALPQSPSYFAPYGRHVRTTVTADALRRIESGRIRTADDLGDDDFQLGLLGNTVGSGATTLYVGGRADQVLKNMEELHYITDVQRAQAVEQLKTMTFKPYRENIRAPHFVLWVKDQVESILEKNAEKGLLEQGGLTIQTTLDWKLQQAAETAVTSRRDDIARIYGAHNIALMAVNPQSREILAYVGNADYSKASSGTQIDMVQAPRQPGSSFKPFVYAAAFQQGYGPATVLYDVPTKFGTDQPQNFDGKFWGLLTARQALGASRNIPAIKAFFMAGGEQPVLDLAESMGVPSPKSRKAALSQSKTFDYGWPLAIGAAETPLLEMVNGYATLADAGTEKPLISILKITEKHGAILPMDMPTANDPGHQALDPRIAYQVTSILSDASVRPNQFWQDILTLQGVQAAAKTGTSNKCLNRNEVDGVCQQRKPDNLWTIGYTPDLAAGVWVGNANSAALSDKADGLNVAAPIWKDFMTRAQQIIQVNAHAFPVPNGLVQPQISLLSGLLPAPCTPIDKRRADIFLTEHAPAQPDNACTQILVDRVTHLLASPNCPAEAQEQESFFLPHSILAERWPLWEQGVQAWAQDQMKQAGTGNTLPLPLAPTEKCDIAKTPGRLVKPTVTILSPAKNGTAPYPSFQPQISFTVGGTASGLTLLLDGKEIDRETPPFRPIIRVPKSVAKSGLHTLQVILTDNYYNTASDQVSFTFSDVGTAPLVRLTSPLPNTTFAHGSGITMRAEASAAAGVKYVEFFLDGTLLTRKPHEPYEITYPLTTLSAGPHTLKAVITDLTGKTSEDTIPCTVSP